MGKLIMIIILAFAIGVTVPKTRAMMEAQAKPLIDKVKAKVVPGRLKAMADELAVRINRGEPYPASWTSWLDRDFTGDPQDPWGHDYYMKRTRDGFTVGSMGPDGIAGNADDIKLKRDLKRR